MDDLISRQAAIDAIKNYWKNEVDRIPMESTYFDVYTQMIDSILSHNAGICKAIDTLPPAQPKVDPVKHGRWDLIDGCEPRRYGCSVCHRLVWHYENYCPNCGAKMDEVEQDEQTD